MQDVVPIARGAETKQGGDETRRRTDALLRIAARRRGDSHRCRIEYVRAQQQQVQDSRDIKIAKPLWLCKNAKFGPSNAKFAKMHKSNAKLLETNF